MGNPHVLVLPYPALGHIIPLMEVSHRLAEKGCTVTFLNTEFAHNCILSASSEDVPGDHHGKVRVLTVPDGLAPGEDRYQLGKLNDSMEKTMPKSLMDLISRINANEEDKITCLIADGNMGWSLEIAKNLGLLSAVVWPSSTWLLAVFLSFPKLVDAGVIDANGFPRNYQPTQLAQTMPAMNPAHFGWLCIGDVVEQEKIFHYLSRCSNWVRGVDRLLCNSFFDLESPAFELVPSAVPIGPILSTSQLIRHPQLSFWTEDSGCLNWLDQQPVCTVIYVSFGSMAMFNQQQIHELALGLELTGRPFLWVCRPNLMDGSHVVYPKGFAGRTASRGRLSGWVPQQQVLSHPSVACFITHCGWNSSIEGVSHGVPMLCWPYFADQFMNQIYIADVWKVGLTLTSDRDGIVKKEEIKAKVEELLADEGIMERIAELEDKGRQSVIDQDGDSSKNLDEFVSELKNKV